MTSLAGAVWPEIPERPLLIVPLGSIEQHGPHLPLGTDAALASAVAETAAGALEGALLAPAIPYGAAGEHEGFPGTVSIGTDVLTSLLVEYARSACRWASRVLVVNGHGGNFYALRSAVPQLRTEGRDVAWFPCAVPGGDAHAGRVETSLMLHVEPGEVRSDRAEAGATAPLRDLLPRMQAEGVRAVSPNGVLGDPAGATAAEGETMLSQLSGRLVGAVATWSVDDYGRLRDLSSSGRPRDQVPSPS
ncbi:mycofactocin biosynthesis peptidyl-dipeptidase MftE [Blastococcus haudaquaticus]|uniref:Creatinine amidohydrolase n=1 Tax=Blastococcus haudaquaticus TaxID=1938745 RepID=A0A286GHQ7_9ACTN|nr:mycofactocin biosynthesis peptidyl-dipeptidase MftE [Blastococcus haudaquaticus]SOD95063.1 creatinine amidohydrolase [Blastococcus haudaquaticus]